MEAGLDDGGPEFLPPPDDLRVLCCGSRNGVCKEHVAFVLWPLFHMPHKNLILAAGGQRGYDTLVKQWARENKVEFKEYAVDYKLDGRWPQAGPKRNRRMYDDFKPNLVLAFPGGRGTEDMWNYALQRQAAGDKVKVLRV